MGQAGNKDAAPAEVKGFHLGVLFAEEAIGVEVEVQGLGQGVLGLGCQAGAEDQQVGVQGQGLADDGVGDAHLELLGAGLDLGLVVQVVAEENDAGVACGLVGGLAKAIGADLAVEQIEFQVGAKLLEFEGVLDRLGAADAGAIGAVRLAGAGALDHDHGASGGEGAVGDLEFELALGEDAGVLAVEVLGGWGRDSAGGDDERAEFNGFLVSVGGDGSPILAGRARQCSHLGACVHLDERMGLHLVDQVLERRLWFGDACAL